MDVEHLALADALRRLPEEQRRAIVLFYLCDMSLEQVAQETQAPAGTVKARLHRARAALAKDLAPMRRDIRTDLQLEKGTARG
jgi:RNA polymerase sigma-70 factor (ECF subfamily)